MHIHHCLQPHSQINHNQSVTLDVLMQPTNQTSCGESIYVFQSKVGPLPLTCPPLISPICWLYSALLDGSCVAVTHKQQTKSTRTVTD
jgi:hypothetical protein